MGGRPQSAVARYLAAIALLVTPAACASGAEPSATRQKTERFDRDPQWDGTNNRRAPDPSPVVEQDFGYSATQHGGKSRGQIGGRVSQSLRSAYYAKVISAATFNEPLSASGRLEVFDAQSIVGWHTQG